MIPVAFDYERPESVEEALEQLATHGDEAKVLAGGHSLLPMMKLRLAYPAVVIDIGRLSELSYVRDEGEALAIGALTRHRDIEINPLVREHAPLLAAVTGKIGDPQVRHRGTFGGSLAHADAAADHPAALLALNGTVMIRSASAERQIAAAELFAGFLESSLEPDELITEIRIPKHTGAGWGFEKFSRRAQDWAIVGAAAQQSSEGPRVSLINMHPTPIRAAATEAALAQGASAAEAAELAPDGLEPSADLNASVEYRRHLARVLTRRALLDAGVS